jgi:hypothetical protein
MSSMHPWLRAVCLAFLVSLSLLLAGAARGADRDDHSYLPPWMRDEANGVTDRGEKLDTAKAASDEAQPPVEQAQLVKITEPPASSFTARVTQAKAKVTKFVGGLYSKSVSFIKGE